MEGTPRVNSALLLKNVGKTVRIVGKVTSINSTNAILEASDKGQVTVMLAMGSGVRPGVVEILGRVTNDVSVQEMSSCMFASDFDADSHDKMVMLAQEHSELFGWS
ncbi:replication factor A protein 3 [Entophlyctis helioformis]|nr:replication factor A protein 3 [Entophlyctis helioformis]